LNRPSSIPDSVRQAATLPTASAASAATRRLRNKGGGAPGGSLRSHRHGSTSRSSRNCGTLENGTFHIHPKKITEVKLMNIFSCLKLNGVFSWTLSYPYRVTVEY